MTEGGSEVGPVFIAFGATQSKLFPAYMQRSPVAVFLSDKQVEVNSLYYLGHIPLFKEVLEFTLVPCHPPPPPHRGETKKESYETDQPI